MKLLIDTDIGDDIDDALAIAWALHLNLDLVGITTVYRDAPKRAKIVKRILEIAGRTDIPVYFGENDPLNDKTTVIGKFNYSLDYDKPIDGDGVRFIAECADRYGSELTVLGLGPQTNLAKAFLLYPESMKKIGRLVLMGGAFFCHSDEWNIAGDPTAAKIVMQSAKNIEYINWDLTKNAEIGKENTDFITNICEKTLRGYIASLVKAWTDRNTYYPILHDPLALYYCYDSSSFDTTRIHAKVIDQGDFSGMTLNTDLWFGYQTHGESKQNANLISVCISADLEKLIAQFMKDIFEKE